MKKDYRAWIAVLALLGVLSLGSTWMLFTIQIGMSTTLKKLPVEKVYVVRMDHETLKVRRNISNSLIYDAEDPGLRPDYERLRTMIHHWVNAKRKDIHYFVNYEPCLYGHKQMAHKYLVRDATGLSSLVCLLILVVLTIEYSFCPLKS